MIKNTTKETETTKVIGSKPTKEEIEKFIKDKWPAPTGTTLRICWMPKWDNYYRLNYWEVVPNKEERFYQEEKIVSSRLVMIEYVGNDWITREYKD